MKTTTLILILLLRLVPVYAQINNKELTDDPNFKAVVLKNNTNQEFNFINSTGKEIQVNGCQPLNMKPGDTLLMKYDSEQKEMIFPKKNQHCDLTTLSWNFKNNSDTNVFFQLADAGGNTEEPAAGLGKQSDSITFLPSSSPIDELGFILKKENAVFGSNKLKYLISCHIAGGNIYYSKIRNGKIVDPKRVRPWVGKDIQVSIKDFNPYIDSVGVSYSFVNNNLEQGEQFASLVGGFNQPAQKTTVEIAKDSLPKAQSAGQLQKALTIFAEEMESYYLLLTSFSSIDPECLNVCIGEINDHILKNFKVSSVNKETIREELSKVIDSIGMEGERERQWQLFNKGYYYYNKIAKYRVYCLLPIQVENSDDIVLDFSVYKNDIKIDSRTYRYYNLGGFKVDFSAGIFGTTLVDHHYTTKVVIIDDTVQKNQIILDDFGRFTVGVGLLAHFYPRINPWVNIALNTGFIIDNTIATKYLFGLSVLFGHEKRFNINAGGVVGQVKRLASGLEVGQYYETEAGQVQTIPTKDVWKVGWYIGLTYNFGSISPKKKSQ